MTERLNISTGSPFEAVAGYSRAVRMGDFVHVAGTTGYDYATMTMPEDVTEQARNCMETIGKALADAGASLEDVVRARYYITDQAYGDAVFRLVGSYFSEIRPAATMIVCQLLNDDMKVEIEVTAQLA